MTDSQQAAETVQYVGPPLTRQIWGRWVEPGELITGNLAVALRGLPDFKTVDTTLADTITDDLAADDTAEITEV